MIGEVTRTTESEDMPLSDIEKGLRMLWSQAAEKWPGAPAAHAMRVCTLNLVVFVSDESLLDRTLDAITAAAQTQPLRAVLLMADSSAPGHDIRGRVAGYCRRTDGGNLHICCEQIILHAKGSAVDELPATTSDLLVPELPMVLWWTGKPPFGTDLFRKFEGISDYLIIDSREFECTQRNLQDIHGSIRRYPQVGLGDLNWARLEAWREGAAGIFDNEEFQPYLARIAGLNIEYSAADGANVAQAMLCAGWFGSRLLWSNSRMVSDPDQAGREFAVSSSAGRDVRIHISCAAAPGIEPGDVAALTVLTDDENARFVLGRKSSPEQIQVSADAPNAQPMRRSLPFQVPSLGDLLAQEVEAMGADAIYEEALLFAADLMTQVEACQR